MTARIMVDDLVAWPLPRNASAEARRVFGGKKSCHLTIEGDSLEPLHAFAARIGMRREWFQDHKIMPHYDLTAGRRARALALGAVYVSAREQAITRRAKRRAEGGAS